MLFLLSFAFTLQGLEQDEASGSKSAEVGHVPDSFWIEYVALSTSHVHPANGYFFLARNW